MLLTHIIVHDAAVSGLLLLSGLTRATAWFCLRLQLRARADRAGVGRHWLAPRFHAYSEITPLAGPSRRGEASLAPCWRAWRPMQWDPRPAWL